jgi:hypothetical protein
MAYNLYVFLQEFQFCKIAVAERLVLEIQLRICRLQVRLLQFASQNPTGIQRYFKVVTEPDAITQQSGSGTVEAESIYTFLKNQNLPTCQMNCKSSMVQ